MFHASTFRHYLSYNTSDQQSVRSLREKYDGILVPGTVATFQKAGTAGFVLSIAASQARPPYVIDPRFPLFQQTLRHIKKSHTALAEICGDPELATKTSRRNPQYFTDDNIPRIAQAWVDFNLGYKTEQSSKFDKYAKLLGEKLDASTAEGPQRILAPYFCVKGENDPWWPISVKLYEATMRAAPVDVEVTQVLATESAQALQELVAHRAKENVCIWVSGLNELSATDDSVENLWRYGCAIRTLEKNDCRSFALYGGFFAIMLSSVGLGGFSHGIGYGDHRSWRELPSSGPPPARYYIPTIHRYVQQDDAYRLWLHDPKLVGDGTDSMPITLEYQDLMRRSVTSRAQEVSEYAGLSLHSTTEKLRKQYDDFCKRLNSNRPDTHTKRIGEKSAAHIPRWIEALQKLAQ